MMINVWNTGLLKVVLWNLS